jgi:hypothetical protein
MSSIKGGFEAMAGLIRVGQNWKRQFRPCRSYLNYNSPSALQNIRRRHPKPCVNVQTKVSRSTRWHECVCWYHIMQWELKPHLDHLSWDLLKFPIMSCRNSNRIQIICLKRKVLHTEDLLLLTVASLNPLHWTWIQLFLLYERGRLADMHNNEKKPQP